MRRITLTRHSKPWTEHYQYDVERICKAFAQRDMHCSEQQAYDMWSEYSDTYAAGWLFLPDSNADIVEFLFGYYKVLED
jgi:hypothetical protein